MSTGPPHLDGGPYRPNRNKKNLFWWHWKTQKGKQQIFRPTRGLVDSGQTGHIKRNQTDQCATEKKAESKNETL